MKQIKYLFLAFVTLSMMSCILLFGDEPEKKEQGGSSSEETDETIGFTAYYFISDTLSQWGDISFYQTKPNKVALTNYSTHLVDTTNSIERYYYNFVFAEGMKTKDVRVYAIPLRLEVGDYEFKMNYSKKKDLNITAKSVDVAAYATLSLDNKNDTMKIIEPKIKTKVLIKKGFANPNENLNKIENLINENIGFQMSLVSKEK